MDKGGEERLKHAWMYQAERKQKEQKKGEHHNVILNNDIPPSGYISKGKCSVYQTYEWSLLMEDRSLIFLVSTSHMWAFHCVSAYFSVGKSVQWFFSDMKRSLNSSSFVWFLSDIICLDFFSPSSFLTCTTPSPLFFALLSSSVF